MPRRKSVTDLDATLTDALEQLYAQQAAFLLAHTFDDDSTGGELKKMEIARLSLESRTRATSGPGDPMSHFYGIFEEAEGDIDLGAAVADTAAAPDPEDLGAALVDIEEEEAQQQRDRDTERILIQNMETKEGIRRGPPVKKGEKRPFPKHALKKVKKKVKKRKKVI